MEKIMKSTKLVHKILGILFLVVVVVSIVLAVVGLGTGSISDVIETDYAFHIVKRLELDDSKLENYYDIVRNNKLVDDIQDMIEDYKIFYENSYKKIK